MSSSRSDSSQKTSTSTTSSAYNQQVGASEGSIAVGGSGNSSTITIERVDADVVKAASDGVTTVAGQALGFGEGVLKSAFDFGTGRSDAAIDLADSTARRSAELADSLRMTLSDAAKAPEERLTTSALGLAALGIVGAMVWKASQ